MLIEPLLRAEPKANTSSEKVQAVDMRKGNQEVTLREIHFKKTSKRSQCY